LIVLQFQIKRKLIQKLLSKK